MISKVFVTLTLTLSSLTIGAEVERRLFTMEKNHNPENIMMIHTQTDEDCKFISSSKNREANLIEFYWMMNHGKSKKEVHSMIRSEIKKRVQFHNFGDFGDSFKISLSDLNELRHDLSETSIEVTSQMSEGNCIVKSVIDLGASGQNKRMDLKRTFCEVSKNIVGIPNGCRVLHLEGTDVDTGEPLKIRFKKK